MERFTTVNEARLVLLVTPGAHAVTKPFARRWTGDRIPKPNFDRESGHRINRRIRLGGMLSEQSAMYRDVWTMPMEDIRLHA